MSFRHALVGTFIAVILGLAGLNVFVIGTVRPQLAQLQQIADEHARAVDIASRLRDQIVAVRRPAIAALTGVAGSGATGPPSVEHWFAAADELQRLADTESERSSVLRLRRAIVASEQAVSAAQHALGAGDPPGFRAALAGLLGVSGEAADAADEIVLFNAREVQHHLRLVRSSLRWLMFVCSSLAVLAIIGALVLLRSALAATDRYTAAMRHHANEMAAFAGRAAHELRSPLHALTLSLASIRHGSAQALDRAEASSRRLKDTIDELLEFSRAGARSAGGHADVARIAAEAIDELSTRAHGAEVRVRATIDDGISVAVAPGYLRTVLTNLIGNAIKYAGKGASVEVACAVEDSRATITVRDDGPGIPSDALEHVFEPFFRASSQPGGYGLGLATVKRLVEAHGGAVRVSSAACQGTTVIVQLPIASKTSKVA